MIETQKYTRKPFHIDAVQVTSDNLQKVAIWASGEVRVSEGGSSFVKVKVNRPLNDRQTKAFVGDWVLYAGTGFKVYTDKAFKNAFDQVDAETTMHSGAAPISVPAVVAKPKPRAPRKAIKIVPEGAPVHAESVTVLVDDTAV